MRTSILLAAIVIAFSCGRASKINPKQASLNEMIDALPDTVYKANLLIARGAEYGGDSDVLNSIMLPWARLQLSRLTGSIGDL